MTDLIRHSGELTRRLRNHDYEVTDSGSILFASMGAEAGGVFETEHRRGGILLSRDISANILPTEGLNHMLDVVLHQATVVPTWYVALFEGNVTPTNTLTAATFTATCTETTAYAEATRVPYVEGTASGGTTDNAASRAVFTINATKTIYGGALISASAKSATSGVILAASKFSLARAVVAADELSVRYSISLTST